MSANGFKRPDELEIVEDDDQLCHAPAAAFRRARAAWGGTGQCIAERAGAYRSFDVQYRMKHGIPSYAYWNLNPASKAGLATPGKSGHGDGDCIDAVGGFQAFLLEHGHEFGWYRPFGDRDPNHWRYSPGLDVASNNTATIPSEDTMYICSTAERRTLITECAGAFAMTKAAAAEEDRALVTIFPDTEEHNRHIARAESRKATHLAAIAKAIGTPAQAASAEAIALELARRLANG